MLIRKLFSAICLAIVSVCSAQCNYNSPISYNNTCNTSLPSIALVGLSGMTNSSSCTGSYDDYTANSALIPKVYRSTKQTLSTKTNFNGFSNTSQYMAAFIDWNGNNTYEDGEFIDLGFIDFNSTFPTSTDFYVPANAVLGSVRMRIRSVSYSEAITSSDLCTTFNFGETEDYTVEISDTIMFVNYTSMQPVLPYSTVVPGSADVPVLRIDAKAEGTVEPLRLEELYFHLPSSVKKTDITAAKLYFTGAVDTFNTDSLITTIPIVDDIFKFTGLTDTLAGASTYYWLAFDLATAAAIDGIIDAVSDSAVFSDSTYSPYQNDPYGTLLVDFCHNESSGDCNYYIERFSLPGVYYSSGCPGGYYKGQFGGNAEEGATYYCTVKTNVASEVAVLADYNDDGDFNDEKEFVKLSVLAGAERGFEISTPDSVATYFRMRIFSAASINSPADACTAENIYDYDFYGYESEPMELDEAHASGVERKLIAAGTTNTVVLSVTVNMYGTGSPLSLNEIKFSTKGTTDISHISNAKLWYTKGNSVFNQDSAALLATLPVITESFSFAANRTLYSGDNFFWLSYDVSTAAADGEKLDAVCDSIRIDSEKYLVGNSNPDGYLHISDTLWMHSATIAQCRTILYDDGGPNGNYSSNPHTLTLTTVPGRYFEVHFKKFALENDGDPDQLSFYEGNAAVPPNLLASYSKNVTPDGSVVTTVDSVLTIAFTAGSAIQGEGWELEIFCKYRCYDFPVSIAYSLMEPACIGGIQKLITDAGPPYKKPLTYTFKAYGVALNYDSVKTADGVQDDTSFYLPSQHLNNQYYYLSVIDSNECKASINVYPYHSLSSPYDLNVDISKSCPYDSSGSITLDPQGTIGATTFNWSGAYTTTNQNIPNAPPGFYTVHTSTTTACKDTSFVIYAEPEYIPTPSGIDGPSDLDNNPGPQRYSLPRLPIIIDGGEGVITQEARTTPLTGQTDYVYNISLVPSNAGTYVLDSTGVTVDWNENFGGEAKLYLRFQHIVTGCNSMYSTPFIIAVESGDTVAIIDPAKAEAAEGFSPNGDGKNDFFVIRNLSESTNTLYVYNREAMIMYKKENYANEWDGTLNGDGKTPIADGTYYWVLKNIEGVDLFKGFLELRR